MKMIKYFLLIIILIAIITNNLYALTDKEIIKKTFYVDQLHLLDTNFAKHYVENNFNLNDDELIDRLLKIIENRKDYGIISANDCMIMPVIQASETFCYMGDKGLNKLIKNINTDKRYLKENIHKILSLMLRQSRYGEIKFKPQILDVFIKLLDDNNSFGSGISSSFSYDVITSFVNHFNLFMNKNKTVIFQRTSINDLNDKEYAKKITELKKWWKINNKEFIKKVIEYTDKKYEENNKKKITEDMYKTYLKDYDKYLKNYFRKINNK